MQEYCTSHIPGTIIRRCAIQRTVPHTTNHSEILILYHVYFFSSLLCFLKFCVNWQNFSVVFAMPLYRQMATLTNSGSFTAYLIIFVVRVCKAHFPFSTLHNNHLKNGSLSLKSCIIWPNLLRLALGPLLALALLIYLLLSVSVTSALVFM